MTFKNIFILSLQFLCLAAYSQKISKVQELNLRAPLNTKVDGKPTEWNKMLAYNPSVELYYTIANDDKKLYLVFQSKNHEMLPKLVNGGVTILIQRSGKKSDNDAIGVKFPYMEKGQTVGFGVNTDAGKGEDPITLNKRISSKTKWIYTKGLLGTDSLISIYNNNGVMAKSGVDVKGIYTSELAIDLSVLGISASSNSKFSYHIIVNGEPNKYVVSIGKLNYVNHGNQVDELKIQALLQQTENKYTALSSTSDFWGEYTLAK